MSERRIMARGCFALSLVLVGVAGVGCAAPPERTTLLRAADLRVNTMQIVDQLAGSDWLRGRDTQSPRIVLRPERLENLSDNRLSQGDQWAAMSMVLLNQRMLDMLRSRNVVVQMPPLRSEAIARAGLTVNEPAAQLEPTHLFSGRLRSLTRAGGGENAGSDRVQRRDTFLFEYVVSDIRSREVNWSGQTEISRLAHGSLID